MSLTEAPTFDPEVAPDVRGPTAPLPATIFALGIASLVVVTLGVVVSQVNYALSDRVLTPSCIDHQISPEDNGAIGVCNIVEALFDPLTSGSLYVGAALGGLALVLAIGGSSLNTAVCRWIAGAPPSSSGLALAFGLARLSGVK